MNIIDDYTIQPGVWPIISKNITDISFLFGNQKVNDVYGYGGNNIKLYNLRRLLPFQLEDPNTMTNIAYAYHGILGARLIQDMPNVTNAAYAFYDSYIPTPLCPNLCNSENLAYCFANSEIRGAAHNIIANNCNMSHAFDNCDYLTEAPRYIKSALDMSYCFSNCEKIGRPVLADDTENAAYAFYNCGNNLTELLFTNNLVNCSSMYYSSRSVNKIEDIARRSGNIFIYAENIQDFNYTFPPFPK